VILVAALLLLVALGLLAAGLVQGSEALQWGSFTASALAALALGIGSLRRRRTSAGDDAAGHDVAGGARGDRRLPEQPVGTAPARGPARGAGATTGPITMPPGGPGQQPATGERLTGPQSGPATGHSWSVSGPLSGPLGAPSYGQPSGPLYGLAGPPTTPPAQSSAERRPPAEPSTGAHAAARVPRPDGEPPAEDVEVTDLLLVLDLTDEVFVVDEHPRYHLADCPHLVAAASIPLPMVEARTDGFTPCGTCAPDHHLAQRERARRAGS
jgi:hypothetical protein